MLPAFPVMVMVTSAGAGGMDVGGDPYPPPPQATGITPRAASARPSAAGRAIV